MTSGFAAQGAARLRVLVVEDEFLVAMMVEEMLVGLGYEVAHMAASLEAGLAAVDSGGFDVAILDINLNGNQSGPVADLLRERGIPFIFATGYGPAGLDSRFVDTPTLQKPFHEDDLHKALRRVTGEGRAC